MSIYASRNLDVALRMLRESPALLVPSLASLLVSSSILVLSVGLFFRSTGASVSSLSSAVLSNLPFALLLGAVDFFIILAVSAYFDSISLYMVRQAWTRGFVDIDGSFSCGGKYALSIIGVDLAFASLVLLFGAGAVIPLFFAGSFQVLSIFSLFFLALSFLSLYWRRESVVLKGGAFGALSFSGGFFGANVIGTVLFAAFMLLVGFAMGFFGDTLSQVVVYALAYLGAPAFVGSSAGLGVFFVSNLLYGAIVRVSKMCAFLDANRQK